MNDYRRRAPRGFTFAPCEGCGNTEGRRIGQVCHVCRDTLDKAAQAREEAAKRGDARVYIVPERPYWLPYLPHELRVRDGDNNDRDAIRSPLLRLTQLVSEPTDEYPPQDAPPEQRTVFAKLTASDSGYGGGYERRRMPQGLRDALAELWQGIARSLAAAHADGHAKGRGLLLSLASGTITNDQFNEAAARLERNNDS